MHLEVSSGLFSLSMIHIYNVNKCEDNRKFEKKGVHFFVPIIFNICDYFTIQANHSLTLKTDWLKQLRNLLHLTNLVGR